ncbi:MAG: tetratricopeptide repeat protein [Acidobacteria bacterium]|nr:tetratricopeptide repeat protein [Acidobacteriota bacterium]
MILTLALYLQTAQFGFINLDDPGFITENPQVRAGLTGAGIWWALTTNYINWQPLVYLSHMLVVTVFGMDPAAHHLLNALLHACNAALVFVVLRRMKLMLWPSAIAAAVFAVHPLRVESVAWVTERKDVLSALFWLLTMWAYVRYAEAPRERKRYWAVIGLFVLGLMSKPMLVTLPVCLLIMDYWPLKRWQTESPRSLVLEKAPMAVLASVVAVVTIITQQAAGAMATLHDVPLGLRAANVVRSYAMYLWKTIWPMDLAIVYPFPEQFPPIELAAAAVVLVALSYCAWKKRESEPWWIAAWLWYIISAAPTIGFIQVGPQPWADRYSYLPSILPLGAVAYALWRRLGQTMFRAAGVTAVALLAVLSWVQIGKWHDDVTLYRHAIAVAPGAGTVYLNLGVALEKEGKFNEAIANYEIARRVNEKDYTANLNIGLTYLLAGRPAEAVAPLEQAAQLRPTYPIPRYHLSRALVELSKLDEAVAQVRKAMQLSPSTGVQATLHMQLGMVSYIRKDDAAALAEFREALRLDPAYWPARKNAGIALGNLGRNKEAADELQVYLNANPNDKDVAAVIAALRNAK